MIAATSGDTIPEGALVKKGTNAVSLFTAGAGLVGIALKLSPNGSTAAIPVDFFDKADWIVGDVGSGTPVAGDFKSCDTVTGGETVAVGTDSSHDFLYLYNGSTTTVDLLPRKVEANVVA